MRTVSQTFLTTFGVLLAMLSYPAHADSVQPSSESSMIVYKDEFSRTTIKSMYIDCFYYDRPGMFLIVEDILNSDIPKSTDKSIEAYTTDGRVFLDVVFLDDMQKESGRFNMMVVDKDGSMYKSPFQHSGLTNSCFSTPPAVTEVELRKRIQAKVKSKNPAKKTPSKSSPKAAPPKT